MRKLIVILLVCGIATLIFASARHNDPIKKPVSTTVVKSVKEDDSCPCTAFPQSIVPDIAACFNVTQGQIAFTSYEDFVVKPYGWTGYLTFTDCGDCCTIVTVNNSVTPCPDITVACDVAH